MTDDIQRRGLVADLGRRLGLASHDELRVLDRVLQRLELGRERYGLLHLARDRRDWRKEQREELLDAMVYDVADELATEDRERADLREAARAEMLGTPAGRLDAVLEAAQTGRITTVQARELLDDLARVELGGEAG